VSTKVLSTLVSKQVQDELTQHALGTLAEFAQGTSDKEAQCRACTMTRSTGHASQRLHKRAMHAHLCGVRKGLLEELAAHDDELLRTLVAKERRAPLHAAAEGFLQVRASIRRAAETPDFLRSAFCAAMQPRRSACTLSGVSSAPNSLLSSALDPSSKTFNGPSLSRP
jgi:hypothetical protein